MALQDQKITSSDLANKGVEGLPDTPNLSTLVMQQKFDEIAKKVIVPKFNALIDYLIESLAPIVSDNPQDGEVLIYFANSSQYKNGVYRTTLSALKDVNVGGVQNKMFLCYDKDRDLWYPEASSGVMETISACKDVSIVNPQTGDIFKFDGTAWANVPDERGLLIVFNIDSEDGATITALTPSGNTVTAKSLGSGQYIIKSDEYGEWHLTGEKNGETVTATVSVDTAKIYDVTMTFFAATITVTYPADATVTCSKGSEEYTATGSPYTFTVHESGDWVIEGTRSGITETQTVTITTNGQSESVTLTILPDGSTVTPTDSIPTLLHCADIWDKSYTSIGEVLDDNDSLLKILTTDNSIDYLVRSTTYASSVTADSDAMSMIGSYDYASDTLLADSTWATAIANSAYYSSVTNIYVPKMTGDTTPSGVAFDSGHYSTKSAYYPFAQNNSITWTGLTTLPAYVGYKFTRAVLVKICKVVFQNGINGDDTSTWVTSATYKYQGSNDNSVWSDLTSDITVSDQHNNTSGVVTSLNNNSDYSYIRFYLTQETNYDSGSKGHVQALQFYGRENGGVQTWLRSGGITDKSYTTLAEVLADTTTLSALIANHDAVNYLVTAKGLIDGIVADSTAMSYIGLNNYCANTLLADAEWAEAIGKSTYKESVENAKVPTMTGATTPSGEAFSSTNYSGYDAWKAFNGNNNSTGWVPNTTDTFGNAYVAYYFNGDFVKLASVELYLYYNSVTTYNITVKVQGSNDGNTWTDIATNLSVEKTNNIYKYGFPALNGYKYARVVLMSGSSITAGSGWHIQFYGREDV
jgi:hypothetical protein